MEKRREKRVKCRQIVTLITDTKEHPGIVTDVSKKGLFIETVHHFKPGEVIDVVLKSGSKTIHTKVQIRWRKNVHLRYHSLSKRGIGVLTIDARRLSR